ncbi:MAG: auxin-regulated protein [Rhodospirillales bacterium 20-64-7]|nr:MAG: auxin-regulated protein [Rhodospirillales bacterium 20-64-7]HQT78740.1 GH3 auxin-responsive promoter family protein [Rhodopila sp.]
MMDATPLLRAYARRRLKRLAAEHPAQAQTRQLQRLLRSARGTAFGAAHGFGRMTGVADFQANVPLRRYEDFWREWWQPSFPTVRNATWPGTIPYFAATSGTTTGNTKYIPVSRQMMASNRSAALDILVHHLAVRPDSRILAGRSFMLGGSTDLVRQAPGIYSGDLSGIAANAVPRWAQPRYFPPRALALIADWDRKTDLLAELSLRTDIRCISGTPSWVLPFFGKLAALRPDRPARSQSWYPNLELFIHGGINFAPYRAQFQDIFAGSHVDMREVYPASEGFIAIADGAYGEGLRLILDNGLFLEFVPVEEIGSAAPTRHWVANVQRDVNYAVVVSSNAGLWAYVLGDTVRFVDLQPPRVLITGRLSYSLSAFGEHLIGEEIEAAIQQAARWVGARVMESTVAPVYPAEPQAPGGHHFVIEPSVVAGATDWAGFASVLDRALAVENADYAAHRVGMRAPTLTVVAPGTFAAWMRHRGKAGGQNKVPRVINDEALFADLRAFVTEPGRTLACVNG